MRRPTQDRTFKSHLIALALGAASTLALSGAMAGTAAAADPVFRVDLNKTQILRLPASAGSVVIGDTKIADVTVHSPTTLLVVGRGYGETNLVILDRNGHTMVDADIQVTSTPSSHGVRLFKAADRQTYSCAPYCQPSPVLGDTPEFAGAFGVAVSASSAPTSIFESTANALSGAGEGPLANGALIGGPTNND